MGIENNYNFNDDNKKILIVEGRRISSVGPGKVTGDDVVYEPTSLDLAMKAHYLRVVYFLDGPTLLGLGFNELMLKETLFSFLNYYYEVCGRFRGNSDSGGAERPYLKCNDCGVRFVEARSPNLLEEWTTNLEYAGGFQYKELVYHHCLGPDIMFSPPVFLQMTTFKCGGISLGLSWAHLLGDLFSLSQFMYQLSLFLKGVYPTYPPICPKLPPNLIPVVNSTKMKYKEKMFTQIISSSLEIDKEIVPNSTALNCSSPDPLSLKEVGPLGDHWVIGPPSDMETECFHVTSSQLDQMLKKENCSAQTSLHFEGLCALIWQAIAKSKPEKNFNVVTVIKKDPDGPKLEDMVLGNNQIVSTIEAHFSVADSHAKDIVSLIHDQGQDERASIAAMVDRYMGRSDFIVYGANLTFVDLSPVGFYQSKPNGLRPKLVNCFVDGLGEEGVVLVMPSPNDDGKVVTMILPKSYMEATKQGLKKIGVLMG